MAKPLVLVAGILVALVSVPMVSAEEAPEQQDDCFDVEGGGTVECANLLTGGIWELRRCVVPNGIWPTIPNLGCFTCPSCDEEQATRP